jgi:uncharacterized protein DUF4397
MDRPARFCPLTTQEKAFMFKKLATTLFAVTLLAVLAVAGPAGAAGTNGTVYVVHGIPGVTVDVYVNGTKTLPNFAPGKVAGPLSLPAGSYAIKIFKAGDNPATTTAVIDQTVALPAGANVSLVAGLSAAGKPTLFTFVNNVSAAATGKGRLAVAHTAAAPAVDVLANGSPAFTSLLNGKEDTADLPAGTISASVVAAGTTSPALIGPANVPVTAGMLTVVYAVGAPKSASAASTLGVVSQQIPLAAAPAMVQTGTAGLLDRQTGGIPTWAFIGLLLAAAGILGSSAVLIRSRAQA